MANADTRLEASVKSATSGDTVTVACKIAVPFLDLELSEMREVSENTQTGPRTIKQGFRTGEVVRIRGTAYPSGQPPAGFYARPELIAGYSLTHNVSKDFWDKWVAQHAKDAMVRNHMIFASPRADTIQGMATEFKGLTSGLEPLDPKKDARAPQPLDPALTGAGTEERFGKRFAEQA